MDSACGDRGVPLYPPPSSIDPSLNFSDICDALQAKSCFRNKILLDVIRSIRYDFLVSESGGAATQMLPSMWLVLF